MTRNRRSCTCVKPAFSIEQAQFEYDTLLFRGQAKGNRIGLSWARSPHIALKFALHCVGTSARSVWPWER